MPGTAVEAAVMVVNESGAPGIWNMRRLRTLELKLRKGWLGEIEGELIGELSHVEAVVVEKVLVTELEVDRLGPFFWDTRLKRLKPSLAER